MRKRYRVLLIAAFVAAVAGRFGYALSIDPSPKPVTMYARGVPAAAAAAVVTAPVGIHSETATDWIVPPVPDAGKLLLVGTFLFGLSAIVRRAI
jgi:uncharacterized membrane protein YgdD (TMEM256/DUF423 family)